MYYKEGKILHKENIKNLDGWLEITMPNIDFDEMFYILNITDDVDVKDNSVTWKTSLELLPLSVIKKNLINKLSKDIKNIIKINSDNNIFYINAIPETINILNIFKDTNTYIIKCINGKIYKLKEKEFNNILLQCKESLAKKLENKWLFESAINDCTDINSIYELLEKKENKKWLI